MRKINLFPFFVIVLCLIAARVALADRPKCDAKIEEVPLKVMKMTKEAKIEAGKGNSLMRSSGGEVKFFDTNINLESSNSSALISVCPQLKLADKETACLFIAKKIEKLTDRKLDPGREIKIGRSEKAGDNTVFYTKSDKSISKIVCCGVTNYEQLKAASGAECPMVKEESASINKPSVDDVASIKQSVESAPTASAQKKSRSNNGKTAN